MQEQNVEYVNRKMLLFERFSTVAGTVEGKDLSCSGNGERAQAVAQRCVKRLVSRGRRQTEIRKFAKAG